MEILLGRPSVPEETACDKNSTDEKGGETVFGFGNAAVGGSEFEVYDLEGWGEDSEAKQESNTRGKIVQTSDTCGLAVLALEQNWESDKHQVQESVSL